VGGVQGGEMTQTVYAHINKKKKHYMDFLREEKKNYPRRKLRGERKGKQHKVLIHGKSNKYQEQSINNNAPWVLTHMYLINTFLSTTVEVRG
jgi:hypothetical protein